MTQEKRGASATPVSLGTIKDTQNFRIPQIPNDNYIDATPYVSWKDCIIDLTQEYPEPEFMLTYNQLKFFTTGDIVVFKGKPKKGKSHAMLTFITALLSGSSIGIERLSEPKKILYVELFPRVTVGLQASQATSGQSLGCHKIVVLAP